MAVTSESLILPFLSSRGEWFTKNISISLLLSQLTGGRIVSQKVIPVTGAIKTQAGLFKPISCGN